MRNSQRISAKEFRERFLAGSHPKLNNPLSVLAGLPPVLENSHPSRASPRESGKPISTFSRRNRVAYLG